MAYVVILNPGPGDSAVVTPRCGGGAVASNGRGGTVTATRVSRGGAVTGAHTSGVAAPCRVVGGVAGHTLVLHVGVEPCLPVCCVCHHLANQELTILYSIYSVNII